MFCSNCGSETEDESDFCGDCGKQLVAHKKEAWKYKEYLWIIILLLIIGAIRLTYDGAQGTTLSDSDPEDSTIYNLEPSIEPLGYFSDPSLFDSKEISTQEWLTHLVYFDNPPPNISESAAGAVVKILCEDSSGDVVVGSGTNFDPEGYILTNYHVIEGEGDSDCIVGFPDPSTGLIAEMYWATPITGASEAATHDLAILSITEPVFDEENSVFGYHHRLTEGTFPSFNQPDQCANKSTELGEEIRILGYPLISGGALTITNGLVSSLYSPSSYIVTSAKINGGNSGGLAIDKEGCHVGVPVAVYGDTHDDPLGEIIDSEFIVEFLESLPE